uniref:F-box domain-containing protein n=1 Tax=Stomoxys calcitrans TaxID=35570 RepID=A0A1I8PNX5_STOCA
MSLKQEGKAFDRVFANVELLRFLFQLLETEHQYKFATVSGHFYDFYREFISREEYRRIIVEKLPEFVSITNEDTQQVLYLSHNGLQHFLQVYAQDIQQMTEIYGCAINTELLKNLTSISYSHMIMTNQHLQMLAKNCPQLERLDIFGCCNKNREIIKLGEDLTIHTLLEMRNLKRFSLKNGTDFRNKTTALQNMLLQLKVQYQNVKSYFVPAPEDLALETTNGDATNHSLEEFDIYGSFLSSFWSWNLKTFLSKFVNLTALTIALSDVADDEVIATLANCCQKLQSLHFKQSTFKDIQTFSVLKRLRELSFVWCKGLSYDNLKEILSEMSLEKFSSTYTKYYGLFQYYFISPTLKSIHIDAFHSFEFRSE